MDVLRFPKDEIPPIAILASDDVFGRISRSVLPGKEKRNGKPNKVSHPILTTPPAAPNAVYQPTPARLRKRKAEVLSTSDDLNRSSKIRHVGPRMALTSAGISAYRQVTARTTPNSREQMFGIYEDTLDVEAENLMFQYTRTLKISSDNESHDAAKDDRKENTRPTDNLICASAAVATLRVGTTSDEPRTPLGTLEAGDFYTDIYDYNVHTREEQNTPLSRLTQDPSRHSTPVDTHIPPPEFSFAPAPRLACSRPLRPEYCSSTDRFTSYFGCLLSLIVENMTSLRI